MHEYDAIRHEIDTSVSNGVSILSFGAATSGLLVAAAGELWSDAPLLAGLLLLAVVPAACFLSMAIHAGETVRCMRAGLFLHDLENHINRAYRVNRSNRGSGAGDVDARVLTWEQWGIRHGGPDMSRHNRRAIGLVFGSLAFGFMLAGYARLHSLPEVAEVATVAGLAVSFTVGLLALRWVRTLYAYAHRFRQGYGQGAVAGGSDGGGDAARPDSSPRATGVTS